MTLLRTYARLLNGVVIGQQIVFPAPGHSKRDRSASLKFSPNAPGGFIVHSFAGDDPLPIRDHVRERLGRAFLQGTPFGVAVSTPAPTKDLRTRALAVWKESRDPRGTSVEAYFRHRKIELFEQASGETVRYHPECPFAGEYLPAMVCLVRDIVTNEPKAIHRTALTPQGDKAHVRGQSRLSLGPVAGGAIKFSPDEEVTTCLGIGEGLESALSLRHTPESAPPLCGHLSQQAGLSTSRFLGVLSVFGLRSTMTRPG